MTPRELITLAQKSCRHSWRHFGWTSHVEPSYQYGVTRYVLDKKLYSCPECGAHKEGRKIKIMLPL